MNTTQYYFQNLFNIMNNLYTNAYNNYLDAKGGDKIMWKEKSDIYDHLLSMLEVTCMQSGIPIFLISDEGEDMGFEPIRINVDIDICLN